MSSLVRRVQVLFTETQYTELEEKARQRSMSVGAIVREAVQEHIEKSEQAERIAAVQVLGAMRLPVSAWEQMECESVGDMDAA